MEIRELGEGDAARYWALRLEALASEPFAFGMAPDEHRAISLEDTAARLRSVPDHKFTLGAFDGKELTGIVTFVREPGVKQVHKGRIYGVYVTRSHRGRGVGEALISALLRKAREFTALEQILISVVPRQQAAVRLYRRCGFESYGVEPRALKNGEDYLDEDHMILRLR